MLADIGDQAPPFFVVVSGEVRTFRPHDGVETQIVINHAGYFSDEGNLTSGRRAMVRLRVTEPGEVIQLDRAGLRSLNQTDAELGEILTRTFLERRPFTSTSTVPCPPSTRYTLDAW